MNKNENSPNETDLATAVDAVKNVDDEVVVGNDTVQSKRKDIKEEEEDNDMKQKSQSKRQRQDEEINLNRNRSTGSETDHHSLNTTIDEKDSKSITNRNNNVICDTDNKHETVEISKNDSDDHDAVNNETNKNSTTKNLTTNDTSNLVDDAGTVVDDEIAEESSSSFKAELDDKNHQHDDREKNDKKKMNNDHEDTIIMNEGSKNKKKDHKDDSTFQQNNIDRDENDSNKMVVAVVPATTTTNATKNNTTDDSIIKDNEKFVDSTKATAATSLLATVTINVAPRSPIPTSTNDDQVMKDNTDTNTTNNSTDEISRDETMVNEIFVSDNVDPKEGIDITKKYEDKNSKSVSVPAEREPEFITKDLVVVNNNIDESFVLRDYQKQSFEVVDITNEGGLKDDDPDDETDNATTKNNIRKDSDGDNEKIRTVGDEGNSNIDEENETDDTIQQRNTTKLRANSTTTTRNSNAYSNLRWAIIQNDGTSASMIKLVGLKSLFSKQLPKMPRSYIARLVFDKRHTSLAILSDNPSVKDSDEEIIGGICYRAFYDMRLAEIAFCAVHASHQVKGYGTKLMNLLKKHAAETGIEYFITYADNYAIGYFKKQGFTKSITMPKGRYCGLIKDYDGGTPMECYIHPSIDFTRVPEMINAQKQYILSRIELFSNSRTIYEPIQMQKQIVPSLEGISRANLPAAKAMSIPGVMEAGWILNDLIGTFNSSSSSSSNTNSNTGSGMNYNTNGPGGGGTSGGGGGGGGTNSGGSGTGNSSGTAFKNELLGILRKIEDQQFAWPFREPVDPADAPDYYTVITDPIDLSTIDKRIRSSSASSNNENPFYYKSKQMLYNDLMLMVNNCKLYNDDTSTYMQCAISLENYLNNIFDK